MIFETSILSIHYLFLEQNILTYSAYAIKYIALVIVCFFASGLWN